MAEIELTRGYVAIVDDDLFDWLSQWKWFAQPAQSSLVYAARKVSFEGVRSTIWMHRLIACAPPNALVDHRNHNGLDNRRANLRLANTLQNSANANRPIGQTGYRGVRASADGTRFRAVMKVYGKGVTVGWARTAEDAARLYDAAIMARHGDFAVLNFPEDRGEVSVQTITVIPRGRPTPPGKFRGVRRHHSRWAAHYGCGPSHRFLGSFDTPVEAARAYDAYVIQHVAVERQVLNFPEEVTPCAA